MADYSYPQLSATNPSVGSNGATAPISSTEIGFTDGSGNLQGVSAIYPLPITIIGGLANPLPVTDATTHTELTTINTTLGSPFQAGGSIGNTSFGATQSTASALNATVVTTGGATIAEDAHLTNVQSAPGTPQTVAVTIQGNASGIAVPISGTVTVTPSGEQNVNLNQVGGSSISIGQQLAAASLPVILPAATITTLTPPTTVNVQQSTAASLNATVVGTGTFATQAAQSGTWNITNVSGTVSLPTGASTAANQTTIGLQTTKINDGTNTAAVKAASTAPVATDPALVVAFSPNSPTLSQKQAGFSSANAPVYNVYSSTNVTTSAYVQLIASSTSATNWIDIFDSSGQAMILATGGSGSEVIQAYIPPGGDSFSFSIPAGTRVAYKALTANATSGYLLLNLRG